MKRVRDLHQEWMKNKEYRKAYEDLEPEFMLARAVIRARMFADITQEQLAQRMGTTQSVIARLEGGRARPSTQTLQRLAAATGTRLKISFEPKKRRRAAELAMFCLFRIARTKNTICRRARINIIHAEGAH